MPKGEPSEPKPGEPEEIKGTPAPEWLLRQIEEEKKESKGARIPDWLKKEQDELNASLGEKPPAIKERDRLLENATELQQRKTEIQAARYQSLLLKLMQNNNSKTIDCLYEFLNLLEVQSSPKAVKEGVDMKKLDNYLEEILQKARGDLA